MLVYRDGSLISGSLNALIDHMVPTAHYYPDRTYLFAFLLSSRLFIRPIDLFARICDICELQQALDSHLSLPHVKDDEFPMDLKRFARHFVQLLQEWTTTFPYDFRDDRLLKQVQSMAHKCTVVDSAQRKTTSEMLQMLKKRLIALEKYEEECLGGKSKNINNDFTDQYNQTDGNMALSYSGSGHNTNSFHSSNSTNSSTIDITELCSTSTQLAHHLTHIELECLSHIGPEEFVQAFAKENSTHLVGLGGSPATSSSTPDAKKLPVQSQKQKPSSVLQLSSSNSDSASERSKASRHTDTKKTRNLESYIQWFNRLSYLVASEIVKVNQIFLTFHNGLFDTVSSPVMSPAHTAQIKPINTIWANRQKGSYLTAQ